MGDEKPDPLSDVIKGLGLILRAAKTTVERMPKKGLEDAMLETAREVGRAIENVAGVVEREVLGRKDSPPGGGRSTPAARPGDTNPGSPGETGDDRAKGGEGPPKPPDAA
jgi:hypothetical protein